MRIWIDLANSPHPLLFAPVVRRLRAADHEVVMTARDSAQTAALALERWPEVEIIGGQTPKQKTAKLRAIAQRMSDLRRWAGTTRPDVALSHNSYAQIVAARSLRIPSVTAMDFEHQPANHLAFRMAKTVILPQAIPLRALRGQGAARRKVVRYPGLKEELYIGDFEPDLQILQKVGIESRPQTVVVVRTPPSRAVYHSFANPLFEDAVRAISSRDDAICVVLTRFPEQIAALEKLRLAHCVIPPAAIDSRSLMYAADAMLGAGGTMTREAALMRIPTWTLFAGAPPAVDAWLEGQGLLARLTDPRQLAHVGPRPVSPLTPDQMRSRAQDIERVFVGETLAAAGLNGRRRQTLVRTA